MFRTPCGPSRSCWRNTRLKFKALTRFTSLALARIKKLLIILSVTCVLMFMFKMDTMTPPDSKLLSQCNRRTGGERAGSWVFEISSNNSNMVTDPHLVQHIRENVLIKPSELEYNLDFPDVKDPSEEQFVSQMVVPKLLFRHVKVTATICVHMYRQPS